MSVTKQPKQEKFLRETKPLIRHQLPFERQFNKGYPEEPVIPKFDISFAEFNMRLRNIGPDQQQPIDDKAKRVIMNEIEKIPEMYSGRNTYLQKRHYGTVAHNTFKRTGVFYTPLQINALFKRLKDSLRHRLQRSIRNNDSPIQTETLLEKWAMYPLIRFFRRNMYFSESKLRNIIAKTMVIDLEKLEDFPDFEEDSLLLADDVATQEDGLENNSDIEENGNVGNYEGEEPMENRRTSSDALHAPTPAMLEELLADQHYIYEPEYAQRRLEPRAVQFGTHVPMLYAPYNTEMSFQRRMEMFQTSNTSSPNSVDPPAAPQTPRARDIASFCQQASNIAEELSETEYRIMMKTLYETIYTLNFQQFKNPEELMEMLAARNTKPNKYSDRQQS